MTDWLRTIDRMGEFLTLALKAYERRTLIMATEGSRAGELRSRAVRQLIANLHLEEHEDGNGHE